MGSSACLRCCYHATAKQRRLPSLLLSAITSEGRQMPFASRQSYATTTTSPSPSVHSQGGPSSSSSPFVSSASPSSSIAAAEVWESQQKVHHGAAASNNAPSTFSSAISSSASPSPSLSASSTAQAPAPAPVSAQQPWRDVQQPMVKQTAPISPPAAAAAAAMASIDTAAEMSHERAAWRRREAETIKAKEEASPVHIALQHPRPSDLPYSRIHLSTQLLRDVVKPVSPWQAKIALPLATLMGYYSKASSAIRAADHLYARCESLSEQREAFFYNHCGLERTMRNWFAVVDLHLWMVIQRLRSSETSAQQQQGKRVERELLNTLTQDIERRLREFDVVRDRQFARHVKDLLSIHYGSNLALEEGYTQHDTILASAIWRNVFNMSPDASAAHLADVVQYVRRQMHHLNHLKTEDLLQGQCSFAEY